MIGVEVFVNGTKRCVAGLVDGRTVNATLVVQAAEIVPVEPRPSDPVGLSSAHVFVGAMDSVEEATLLSWLDHELTIGDEVCFRIVETTTVSTPVVITDVESPPERSPHGDPHGER